MNTRMMTAVSLCFFMLGCASPAYTSVLSKDSSVALSATLDKQGIPQGEAANTPNADLFITDQVKQAFSDNKDFYNNNIKFETVKGVVTISGKVSDENAKVSIGKKVLNVPGVKGVENKLEVNK